MVRDRILTYLLRVRLPAFISRARSVCVAMAVLSHTWLGLGLGLGLGLEFEP